MKISIGNDHAAVQEKEAVVQQLKDLGHEVTNVGTDTTDSTDYPDLAALVAKSVVNQETELGILICGTGIGMSIAANKVKGIRAALCHSTETAEKAREHNDANVICCGARVTSLDDIQAMIATFVATPFANGRHQRRVDKMMDLQEGA
ncbi:MAG: ribose 5-phosphate isomerase B [Planctomycetota bacterium]|jgi:ribose 5-phosphate isomerase B